jgi:ribonuclease HI/deoxyadenosine/deoxycytidine kinase
MNSPLILSIDGNIGSGKSTLYADLQTYYANNNDICFVPEPVDDWKSIVDRDGTPILTNLYKDTQKYAFRFQMMAYISRLHLLRQKIKENKYKIIISERCVQTDKNVFAQMLFDDGMIDHDEFQIYLNWFDEFLDDIVLGGIIYVRAEPDVCDSRVKIRAREGETIPLEYLTKCHNYHEQWLNDVTTSQLVINADVDTSLPENKYIRQEWIDQINDWIENQFNKTNNDNNNNQSTFKMRFDGACRGNPSNILGMGAILYDEDNRVIDTSSRKYEIEEGTNNVAEYLSLIDGLRLAQTNNVKNILVEGDSQLIINQINGTYKVNSPKLLIYHNVVKSLIEIFDKIEFQHIRREFNKEADQLANKALDEPEVESTSDVNLDNNDETNKLPTKVFNDDDNDDNIVHNSCTGFE